MKFSPNKITPALCAGCLLFLLRLMENLTGFDRATGLTTPTVLRYILVAAVLLALLLTPILCRGMSIGRPLFPDHFSAPEKKKTALVFGSFLFLGGAVALGAHAVMNHAGIAPLVTAVLAFASGAGLLVLTRQMGIGETESVTPLLPVLFFAAFWVLTLYIPAGSDPILARYWLPILAAAAAAYAFSLLAGFFRGETKVRTFNVVGRAAVMLCLAAAAELTLTFLPLFLGSALILSVFLSLQKN